ncbi:MAG: hypothetical protein ACLP9L_22250 [Thermoguttaceae bacterium]
MLPAPNQSPALPETTPPRDIRACKTMTIGIIRRDRPIKLRILLPRPQTRPDG